MLTASTLLTYREKAMKGLPVTLHNEINIPDIQYYSNSLPVGKERLKERCGLEARTNFFSFKKVATTRCGLDSRIYGSFVNSRNALRKVIYIMVPLTCLWSVIIFIILSVMKNTQMPAHIINDRFK
jgi:hypothetical protein